MSYIDDLNDAASRAQDAADTAESASQILFDVANGDSVSTVTTASGEVKTVAKAISDIEASFEGGLFNSTVEEVTLADGQTAVTLTSATTDSMQLYVEGAREFDFDITGADSFELSESFPTGTRIWVVSSEIYADISTTLVTAPTSGDTKSLPLWMDEVQMPNASEVALGDTVRSLQGWVGGIDYTFMTVAEMSADSRLSVGDKVNVVNYAYAYDGGGGPYIVVAASETEGALVPLTASGLQARMVINDRLDVRRFGANPSTSDDDRDAIQAAIDTGLHVYFGGKGDYIFDQDISDEIEVVTPGQVIEFENSGGYGYGEDIGLTWVANTRLVVKGTGTKRVRTRRLYRESSSDPQDDGLSVVFNVQAEAVEIRRPCIWLECDYSNTSPTNLGQDCDVAIFVGCRVGVQIHDPQIIGYFRKAGIYFDVTHATNLPRFNDLEGNPYPEGQNISGGDGTHIYNPYVRGGRQGVAVLGALPKDGENTYSTAYYDEILGTTVSDFRGTFGFSDFMVHAGRLYGPDHHSDYRLADPTPSGGSLNETSLDAEPDDMPCALYISGMAGNASGSLWGMRLYGTRIATFEAFRVRLDLASRIALFGCHIEGRSGSRYDTSGNLINSNDYTAESYGDIAATSRVSSVKCYGSPRQQPSDGLYNHYYGDDYALETDSGRYFTSGYISGIGGELDLRAADGELVRARSGSSTAATFGTTSTSLIGAGASTVASAANVYITAGGTVSRSTSAAKYKNVIGELEDGDLEVGMRMTPIKYTSKCEADDPTKTYYGFLADQAAELGAEELVTRSEEGEIEGFEYDRMTAIHQAAILKLMERVEELEARLAK